MGMMDLGKLGFDLVLNKKGWNSDFESADNDIEKHEGKWQGFAGNMSSKIKLGIVGAVAGIGVAIGAMAVAGIKNAQELDDQMAKFKSHTGVTKEATEEVKQTVMDLYKVNEDSYEEIVKTAEALSNNMGMNSEDIKKYAQNYLNYAKVTGQANEDAVGAIDDLGDAWGLTADESVSAMDKLLVLNQEYGMSVQDSQAALTKMAPAAKAVGMSMDEASAYMAMFAQTGIDASTSSTAFSKALQNVKSPDELKTLITDIQNCEDPMKRAQLASELFGAKAGPQMAQALGESDLDINKFIENMNKTGGAVTQASDAYDGSLKVQLALMKKQLEGLFTELGEKLSPLIAEFVAWLKEHMPQIQKVLQALFDAVGFAIDLTIGNIVRIAKAFLDWFNGTSEGATQFKEFMTLLWDSLKQIMEGIQKLINTVLEAIKKLCNKYSDDILAAVKPIWNAIKTNIETTMNIIKDIIKIVTSAIKGDWNGVWEGIKMYFIDIWNGIKNLVPSLLEGVFGALRLSFKIFTDLGKGMFNAIWDGMKAIWDGIYSWVSDKISWLVDKLSFWKSSSSQMEGDSGNVNGSHFNGLSYVPYDGYVARLHEGERVLTKDESNSYKTTNSGITQNLNIYSPTALSPSETARQNKRALQELALQL